MVADTISSSFSKIHALGSFIISSIDDLESACKDIGSPWPSLDTPVYASQAPLSPQDIARLRSEAVSRATAKIVAAATQIVRTVREPGVTAATLGGGFLLSSSLRAATELHVVDILRDAGPQGLHVNDISKKLNVDPRKLARLLRHLATEHIFVEVRPDVFANNRISAVLEKGQSIDALLRNPAGKYDRPESALAALVAHWCDECYKGSGQLFETLVNQDSAFSGDPSKCACMYSRDLITSADVSSTAAINANSGATIWEILARPDPPTARVGFRQERLRRFGVAMEVGSRVLPTEEIIQGFDFTSLPPSSVIFDVGGGVGTIIHFLAQKYSHLKFVIQDREEVCKEGILRWKETNPQLLENGQVAFQAQSFLEPQPKENLVKKPAAFLIKAILHDWSDEYCHTILKHLRDAAGAGGETKLLVVDYIVPYACRAPADQTTVDDDSTLRKAIPGVYQDLADAPLLANWGAASDFPYYVDLNMLSLLNGQERTLAQTRSLLRNAGWDIVKITQSKVIGQPLSLVEAKAI